jgi:regulator of protease activity HflC (stomatin/prohibitin superfamily)
MAAYIIVGIIVVAFFIFMSSVRVVREYQRVVVFRLGRLVGARGPGFLLVLPLGFDKTTLVDQRVITMDVPPQDVITRDNVTVRVNAVVYFRVVNPVESVVKVENFKWATSQIAQTTLRNVLGQSELDEVLTQRERLNQALQKIIDEHTDPWGIKVSTVEIKDVELPEGMRRSMAAQAEAERVRRAKIVHADGEFQASQKLADAAQVIAQQPAAIQLRYLQTLTEIAADKNSTILFPIPIEMFRGIIGSTDNKKTS